MSNTTAIRKSSFPLPTLLTVIFVVLKLTGNIDWSWWWVFSPVLISVGLVVSTLLVMLVITVLLAVLSTR